MKTRVRFYRIRAGMTQAELAHKVGISQGAISQIEAGKTVPTLRHLETIAKVFGLRIKELLRD